MPDAAPRPLTAPDVVAGLLADVAERDERLAEVTAERNRIAESCATTAAELTACRERNAAIAAQSDRYRDAADEHEAELQDVHDALTAAWPGKDLTEGAEALLVAALVTERDDATADRDNYAARLKATDQSWAKLAAERDAHKLRADHYEGLWRAEHGLPPEGTGDLTRDRDLAARVRAVIARYKDDEVGALTAFADIMDAAGEPQ